MSFILFIILFLIIVFVFVSSVAMSLLRGFFSIFSTKGRRNSSGERASHSGGNSSQWRDANVQGGRKEKKIIFDKDEGEYVDFEEIKD